MTRPFRSSVASLTRLHDPRPARATPSIKRRSHPLPMPKVWILAKSLYSWANEMISLMLPTSPSVSKKILFYFPPQSSCIHFFNGCKISVPPKSALNWLILSLIISSDSSLYYQMASILFEQVNSDFVPKLKILKVQPTGSDWKKSNKASLVRFMKLPLILPLRSTTKIKWKSWPRWS